MILAAVMVFAAVPIVRLFADGSDTAFIRLAAGDLRVANCMLWCIGLNVVASTYFQSVGKQYGPVGCDLVSGFERDDIPENNSVHVYVLYL